MFDAPLQRLRTNNRNQALFEIPDKLQQSFWGVIKKYPEWVRVRIGAPTKLRTTGELSQNHKIAALINLIGDETGHTYSEVKTQAKLDALTRGYPYRMVSFKHPITGIITEQVEPYHENEIDTVQASILIQQLESICIDLGIQL